ncbi:hypothetical protein YC2023_051553 [Brassica napus]
MDSAIYQTIKRMMMDGSSSFGSLQHQFKSFTSQEITSDRRRQKKAGAPIQETILVERGDDDGTLAELGR